MTISKINVLSKNNNRIKNAAVIIPIIASAAAPANSQNILQDRFDKFIKTEFSKADIDKSYYIDENELAVYDANIKMNSFDFNKDKKLNIDEFKQIIISDSSVKNHTNTVIQQQNKKNNNLAVPIKNAKPKPKINAQTKREDAIKISNNIIESFKGIKKTKPGLLWGTNTYYEPDAKKVDSALKQINSDNVVEVVKQFCYKQKKHETNIYYILTYLRENNATDDMLSKATNHFAKVLNEYADKRFLKDNPNYAIYFKEAYTDNWRYYNPCLDWFNTYNAYKYMSSGN